jgi:hypothetical protein
MAKQIKIIIDENGNCQADALGFMGAECDRAMREIDTALGTRTRTERKQEYGQVNAAGRIQHGHGPA